MEDHFEIETHQCQSQDCAEDAVLSVERELKIRDGYVNAREEVETVKELSPVIRRPIPFKPSQAGEKRSKLRTSKDVYDRLKWDVVQLPLAEGPDQTLNVSSVYIGYKDRFLGMCELPYSEFQPGEDGDIPFHRVFYFRTGGPPVEPFVGKNGEVKVREHNLPPETVFLWDRDSRTDLIFRSGYSELPIVPD
jgi:hypothetical protein